ncbi:MAG TPA: response regulator [Rickettsiales bacterium]|nr:response regulator [Rickettsiales bacterium]
MKTCLVVDDIPFDRKVITNYVARLGFSVSEAAGGKEALSLCRTSMPDCFLLDLEMPEMDGLEVLREIRSMENGDEVPVIICTSHEHPSFIGHAYINGASSYIIKPVTQDKLESEFGKLGIL